MTSLLLLADPSWYRVEYALASQHLHAASPHTDAIHNLASSDLETTGNEARVHDVAMRLLRRGEDTRAQLHYESHLADAEKHAAKLLVGAAQTLQASGYRYMREDPGRLTRFRRRNAPARRPEFARFLERTVEPSAAFVLVATRIEMHGAFREGGRRLEVWPALEQALKAPPLIQFDRQRLGRDSLVDRTLLDYIGRLNAGQRVDYRAWYTFACLFSRVADKVGVPSADEGSPASWGFQKLATALETAPSSVARDRLRKWAWRDPGLGFLRSVDPERFARVVGKRERIRVEMPQPKKEDPAAEKAREATNGEDEGGSAPSHSPGLEP